MASGDLATHVELVGPTSKSDVGQLAKRGFCISMASYSSKYMLRKAPFPALGIA